MNARPGTVTGWKLDRDQRARLLERFPPQYSGVVADHVTLRAGAGPQTTLPRQVEARIVGRADDHDSLECLVVELDGTTDRPDGSTYHITWSLGPGRAARESNFVLRDFGWEYLDAAVPIDLDPARSGALLSHRLFLDCDGVLADFDEGARRLLGMTPAAFEAKRGKRGL